MTSDDTPEVKRDSAAKLARDAAIVQLVGILVSAAVGVAILKRDYLTRAWRRLRSRPMPPAAAAEARAVAEFRRELADLNHPPAEGRRRRGLYEGETR